MKGGHHLKFTQYFKCLTLNRGKGDIFGRFSGAMGPPSPLPLPVPMCVCVCVCVYLTFLSTYLNLFSQKQKKIGRAHV